MAERDPAAAPSHRRYAAAVIALLLLAQACGLWLLYTGKLDPARLKPSAWLDGDAGKALGEALQPKLQDNADTLSAAVRYRLLGDLGAQVVQGCPGWLFYRDGLRAQPGVRGAYEARLRLMRHWSGQLREQGLQVLLVAVPDKARIETHALCGLQQSAQMQARLGQWQASLAEAGVAYVDLATALAAGAEQAPRFFRTDVHLNSVGAQAAADAVAAAALPLLGGKREQQFDSSGAGPAQPRMGDLITLAGLEHAAAAWRPALTRSSPSRSCRAVAVACLTTRQRCKCSWSAARMAGAAPLASGWAATSANRCGTRAWMAGSSAAPCWLHCTSVSVGRARSSW